MNYELYASKALRTLPKLGGNMDLVHMVLGMGSELVELSEAIKNDDIVNIGEELTDGQWYFANYCFFREFTFSSFQLEVSITNEGAYEQLVSGISELQDYIKKYVAYGKELDRRKEIKSLNKIQEAYLCLYYRYNLNVSDCMQANIEKLMIRFPDKFNTENAINRDTDEERTKLEERIQTT